MGTKAAATRRERQSQVSRTAGSAKACVSFPSFPWQQGRSTYGRRQRKWSEQQTPRRWGWGTPLKETICCSDLNLPLTPCILMIAESRNYGRISRSPVSGIPTRFTVAGRNQSTSTSHEPEKRGRFRAGGVHQPEKLSRLSSWNRNLLVGAVRSRSDADVRPCSGGRQIRA